MFRPEQFGKPFHGEFSSADASALTEANSRFTLYGVDKSAITLTADERVLITDIDLVVVDALTVTLYDGANNTVGAGETIFQGSLPAGGWFSSRMGTPHYCRANASVSAPAGYPKVITSGAGQVDCTVRGVIVGGNV